MTAGGTMSNRVKTEKRPSVPAVGTTTEERELEEWARRLVSRPTPQIGTAGAGQPTLNNFLNLGNPTAAATGADGLPPHNGFDKDSAIGRFTWYTVAGDKYIPCIFRCNDKFCSVKMAEISALGDLLRLLPVELYECVNLKSYSASNVEARLLGHINAWHCDGFYGSETFSTKEQLIRVEDIEKFYNFLYFAYAVLSTGGRNENMDYSKCAFIKVNSDNLIPYTVLPGDEKGVPLFYFEGQTDILKEKAVPLEGWELAYLKVCCKVQGVRKDLIAGNTLQIVKVSDLRSYFPRRTVFTEECWPDPKSKSLLSSKNNNGTIVAFPNNAIPSCDKWANSVPYVNPAAPRSNCPSGMVPSSGTTTASTFVSITAKSSTSDQAPVIPVRNGSATNNSSVAVRVAKTNGAPSIPMELQAKSDALKKIKVLSPPQALSQFQLVPEFNDPLNRDGAYSIRLIIIDKELMHCINLHPFKNDTYLVVLQQFMNQFFPSISIYPTAVSVLKTCGVATFMPNQAQIRTLNSFGFMIQHPWQIPLIQAVAVTQVMTKLKEVFRPRNAASAIHNSNSSRGAPGPRSNGYAYTIR